MNPHAIAAAEEALSYAYVSPNPKATRENLLDIIARHMDARDAELQDRLATAERERDVLIRQRDENGHHGNVASARAYKAEDERDSLRQQLAEAQKRVEELERSEKLNESERALHTTYQEQWLAQLNESRDQRDTALARVAELEKEVARLKSGVPPQFKELIELFNVQAVKERDEAKHEVRNTQAALTAKEAEVERLEKDVVHLRAYVGNSMCLSDFQTVQQIRDALQHYAERDKASQAREKVLEKDKERLDWITEHGIELVLTLGRVVDLDYGQDCRLAIDAARKESK